MRHTAQHRFDTAFTEWFMAGYMNVPVVSQAGGRYWAR